MGQLNVMLAPKHSKVALYNSLVVVSLQSQVPGCIIEECETVTHAQWLTIVRRKAQCYPSKEELGSKTMALDPKHLARRFRHSIVAFWRDADSNCVATVTVALVGRLDPSHISSSSVRRLESVLPSGVNKVLYLIEAVSRVKGKARLLFEAVAQAVHSVDNTVTHVVTCAPEGSSPIRDMYIDCWKFEKLVVPAGLAMPEYLVRPIVLPAPDTAMHSEVSRAAVQYNLLVRHEDTRNEFELDQKAVKAVTDVVDSRLTKNAIAPPITGKRKRGQVATTSSH